MTEVPNVNVGGCCAGALAISVVVGTIVGLFTLAWNSFCPAVFGLPEITLLQALCGMTLLWIVAGLVRAVTK